MPRNGLTVEAVRAISRERGEPQWASEARLRAWQMAEELPVPGPSNVAWKRTDLGFLQFDELLPFHLREPVADLGQTPAHIRDRLDGGLRQAGLLLQEDSSPIYTHLDVSLARRGVIFTSLDRALTEHPDLVREYLGRCIQPQEDKFAALHGAFWSGGVFLYLPAGVTVGRPFRVAVSLTTPGLAIFPRTLVVLERGASATLVEEHISGDMETRTFSGPVVELYVGAGAQLRYLYVLDWGKGVVTMAHQRALVDRDARVDTLTSLFGGDLAKTHVETVLRGPGSRSQMLGLSFGRAQQHFDKYTAQTHLAPHTESDLLFHSAVKEKARTLYYGTIRIDRGAQKASAMQTDRSLLLSQGARADSTPVLEIQADDVRCSHAAAVGPVDQEQLFYLMSRGLALDQATRLLAEAFFHSVLERIPIRWLRERLQARVRQRIEG